MGAWGEKPYDNDTAADWFDHLFNKTKFAAEVEKGLASDNIDEQRAAAFVVEKLAVSVYVWPFDSYDRLIGKAIDVLLGILGDIDWLNSWDDKDEVVKILYESLNNLKERLVEV